MFLIQFLRTVFIQRLLSIFLLNLLWALGLHRPLRVWYYLRLQQSIFLLVYQIIEILIILRGSQKVSGCHASSTRGVHWITQLPLSCSLLFFKCYFAKCCLEFCVNASNFPISVVIKRHFQLIQVSNVVILFFLFLLLSHLYNLILNRRHLMKLSNYFLISLFEPITFLLELSILILHQLELISQLIHRLLATGRAPPHLVVSLISLLYQFFYARHRIILSLNDHISSKPHWYNVVAFILILV